MISRYCMNITRRKLDPIPVRKNRTPIIKPSTHGLNVSNEEVFRSILEGDTTSSTLIFDIKHDLEKGG